MGASQLLSVKKKFQLTMKKIYDAVKKEEAKQSKDNVVSAFKVTMPGGEELTFDVDDFRPSKVSMSGLTYRARQILAKDPPVRTESELRALMASNFTS